MTDKELFAELGSTSPLNRARKRFSHWSAKIEQAGQQRTPLTAIQMRKMEFEAVKAIAKELGVTL